MNGPLTVALLVMFSVLALFMAVWQFVRSRQQASERLEEYGRPSHLAATAESTGTAARRRNKRGRSGLGSNLAAKLSSAGLSLTATEYVLITFCLAFAGFVVGTIINGPLVGIVVGIILMLLPGIVVRSRISKQKKALTQQLPNVLTLLVSALRAGYGLTQSLELVVDQVEEPAAEIFGRVIRSVALGIPIQQALEEMAEQVRTDDMDLVVTAITVQYEMGGNLAETLENIGETITERIRIKREINSLTAQQRMTGYVLALLPAGVFLLLFVMSPSYISGFTTEPILMVVAGVAIVMQIVGFLVIRRIVDIEV